MNLGYPFLIYGLCQQAEVPLEDNEAWKHTIKAIMVKRDKPGVPRPEGMLDSTRMSFTSIRLILASRAIPRVTLGTPPRWADLSGDLI